jgi:hypothetical protein
VHAFVVCVVAPLGAQAGYAPDVLPRGGWALSLDTQGHRASQADANWLWALPGATVGVGHGLDAGVRVSLFEPWRGTGAHDLVPQLRWRAWSDSTRGLRAGVSAIGLVPIGGVGGRDARALLTATAAWTLASTGTGLTVGGWQGVQQRFEPGEARHGVILEAGQALDRAGRTQLSASWFSGRTLFGYLTVGVSRDVGAHTLFVGWAHGNEPRSNTGPTVSWSWSP